MDTQFGEQPASFMFNKVLVRGQTLCNGLYTSLKLYDQMYERLPCTIMQCETIFRLSSTHRIKLRWFRSTRYLEQTKSPFYSAKAIACLATG